MNNNNNNNNNTPLKIIIRLTNFLSEKHGKVAGSVRNPLEVFSFEHINNISL